MSTSTKHWAQRICLLSMFVLSFTQYTTGHTPQDSAYDTRSLIRNLKDIYTACSVSNVVMDYLWLSERPVFLCYGHSEEMFNLYTKRCRKMLSLKYNDDSLSKKMQRYLISFIENSFKFEPGMRENLALYKYLESLWPLSQYLNLSKEAFDVLDYRKNYIKSGIYRMCSDLEMLDPRLAAIALIAASKKAKDFPEYAFYQMEAANLYASRRRWFGWQMEDTARSMYHAILDAERYTPCLYNAWVKWRSLSQYHYGSSLLPEIPNEQYNEMREKAINVLHRHIVSSPYDKQAIFACLRLSTEGKLQIIREPKYERSSLPVYAR